jgi:hypothetical protein
MANVPESSASYPVGVTQIETGDAVLGGLGGTANEQATLLASRTAYLKAQGEITHALSNLTLMKSVY